MSYLDWHVGMKVVCAAGGWPVALGETPPVEGEVYTIRTMSRYDDEVYIRLVEIVNRPMAYIDIGVDECDWSAVGFRPVETKKTDISIFTAMLTGTKTKVPA